MPNKIFQYHFLAPPELVNHPDELESFTEWPFRDQIWKAVREGGVFMIRVELKTRKTPAGMTKYEWWGWAIPQESASARGWVGRLILWALGMK